MKTALSLCFFFAASSVLAADRVPVTIVQRQNAESAYSAYVPRKVSTTTNGYGGCSAYGNTANCNSRTSTTGSVTEGHSFGYSVTGFTFTLRTQDGKLVVVNCESKYSPKGDRINRRSCKQPMLNDIQAEFKGKNAKLFWPVSLDGKKFESETYSIIALLPAP